MRYGRTGEASSPEKKKGKFYANNMEQEAPNSALSVGPRGRVSVYFIGGLREWGRSLWDSGAGVLPEKRGRLDPLIEDIGERKNGDKSTEVKGNQTLVKKKGRNKLTRQVTSSDRDPAGWRPQAE